MGQKVGFQGKAWTTFKKLTFINFSWCVLIDEKLSIEDKLGSKFTAHIFLINNVIRFRRLRQKDKSAKRSNQLLLLLLSLQH